MHVTSNLVSITLSLLSLILKKPQCADLATMKGSMLFTSLLPNLKKCILYLDELLHQSPAFLLLKKIGKLLLSKRARRCCSKSFLAIGLE